MTAKTLSELTALADAFTLLEMLLNFPEYDMIAAAVKGALTEDILAISQEGNVDGSPASVLLQGLAKQNAQDALIAARREFTRLFNHPEHPCVQLYEGQFLYEQAHLVPRGCKKNAGDKETRPRLFVNPASLDMDRELRKAGLRRMNDRAMPADAMPVQMGFASKLFLRQAHAMQSGDGQGYKEAINSFAELKHYHLDVWMKPFFEACVLQSHHPLYKAMGAFGLGVYEALVRRDKELFSAA